jgi:hypothetical protein
VRGTRRPAVTGPSTVDAAPALWLAVAPMRLTQDAGAGASGARRKPSQLTRTVRASAVLGILFALLAVPATAGSRAPTAVSLTQDSTDSRVFKGRVTSPERSCRNNRTVRLEFRYLGGEIYRLGTATTGRKGRYKFTVEFDGTGDLYTKVRATPSCRRATSNKIFIGGT